MGTGDCIYTIAELFGVGASTVQSIMLEISQAIFKNMWKSAVINNFSSNKERISTKIVDMEQFWQFPCTWGAVDGCHLPILSPHGCQEARKEYHNFKIFYSVVMMAVVVGKDRFVWASIGFPGNSMIR